MLGRPQEGNQVVLVVGLWLNLIDKLEVHIILQLILVMTVFVTWNWRPRRPKLWQIRALAIAYVPADAIRLTRVLLFLIWFKPPQMPYLLVSLLPLVIEFMAVLLVNLRPRRIANLISTPCGRKLISLAKVTSALLLASDWPLTMIATRSPIYNSVSVPSALLYLQSHFIEPFALLVLHLAAFRIMQ
jgi:hypothetical protein